MSISKIEEAGFIQILGKALNAGNIATKGWDPNNWFPCGSSNVLIKPRTSKFARWLLENVDTFKSHSKVSIYNAEYKKAILIRTDQFNQSVTPQEIWTTAVAAVLREYNINASTWSYID